MEGINSQKTIYTPISTSAYAWTLYPESMAEGWLFLKLRLWWLGMNDSTVCVPLYD